MTPSFARCAASAGPEGPADGTKRGVITALAAVGDRHACRDAAVGRRTMSRCGYAARRGVGRAQRSRRRRPGRIIRGLGRGQGHEPAPDPESVRDCCYPYSRDEWHGTPCDQTRVGLAGMSGLPRVPRLDREATQSVKDGKTNDQTPGRPASQSERYLMSAPLPHELARGAGTLDNPRSGRNLKATAIACGPRHRRDAAGAAHTGARKVNQNAPAWAPQTLMSAGVVGRVAHHPMHPATPHACPYWCRSGRAPMHGAHPHACITSW